MMLGSGVVPSRAEGGMAETRTTLVGRERHLREIRLIVDAVSAGTSHVLVLSGEAGADKTTLVRRRCCSPRSMA